MKRLLQEFREEMQVSGSLAVINLRVGGTLCRSLVSLRLSEACTSIIHCRGRVPMRTTVRINAFT